MRNFICIVFCLISVKLFCQIDSFEFELLSKKVDFLEQNHLSSKDYILKQFEKYDIVILAERYHAEETQYELIDSVINSDYFIKNVGNVCVEIGCSNFSNDLNSFITTYTGELDKADTELIRFQQEISWYPLWSKNSYHIFLKNLLKTNIQLKQSDKVNLYLCDIEFNWESVKTYDDLKKANIFNRDSIMALNIIKHFEEIKNTKRPKLLCILNEAHAVTNTEWIDMWEKRCGQYLAEKYGKSKISSILINSVGTEDNDENDILLQNGYWDASFYISNRKDVGFDFINSPFGQDGFDYAEGKNNELFNYQDIFNGLVFYKPINEHILSVGVTGIITDDFIDEFKRRYKIRYPKEVYEELSNDTILSGWNTVEIYQYDDQDEMIKRIEELSESYYKKVGK